MDFELSDDERALADGIHKLCVGRFDMGRLRASEGRAALDAEGWAALADAGVFALSVPEESGGLGLGMGHAVVVFEEIGRALVPGPLAATLAAAAVVEGAGDGSVPVGLLRMPVEGSGAPLLVDDFGSLGALVVIDDASMRVVDPAKVNARRLERSIDPLTPLWLMEEIPAGEVRGDAPEAARTWRDFSLLQSALLVGNALATVDLAVAYAKEREQFGHPIGSFQAVKHMCADMLVRAELARCAVQAAAVTVDQPDVGDPWRAAAGAALLAAEAGLSNGKTCIQVHGGMGFTWEVPAHLYLMRARLLAQSLGPQAMLADIVAELF